MDFALHLNADEVKILKVFKITGLGYSQWRI